MRLQQNWVLLMRVRFRDFANKAEIQISAGPFKVTYMFKILYTTDLHGNKALYNKLAEYTNKKKEIKAVIIGGDICPRFDVSLEEYIRLQKEFIENFLIAKLKEIKMPLFIMMGNDDCRVNMPSLEKGEKQGVFKILHKKLNKVNGKNIVGYSFVNEMPFLLKDWEKLDDKDSKHITDPKLDVRTIAKENGTIEEDLEKLKKIADPKKTIYVIHAPPFDTDLDIIATKKHVGSRSVRRFIENEQPFLVLSGHIHESVTASGEFMDRIGNSICINPGSEYIDSILNAAIIDLDNLEDIEHEMI